MSRRVFSTVTATPRPARKATRLPPRIDRPAAPKGTAPPQGRPRRQVARIIETSDTSLLDVLDNLLNKGVVLNADIILALAGVDLIYLRLSALLCAADRVFPHARGRHPGPHSPAGQAAPPPPAASGLLHSPTRRSKSVTSGVKS